MKVILVGYMGSGKTTVGQALAEKLGIRFLDLDTAIEEGERNTITELFETVGQIRFRKKEHHYLNELLGENTPMVLATGGGAPCYSGNMKTILEASPNVFYLRLSIPELVKRLVPEKAERPLISHLSEAEMPEFLGKHLFERNNFYQEAHHTINCDGKTQEEVTSEIQRLLI